MKKCNNCNGSGFKGVEYIENKLTEELNLLKCINKNCVNGFIFQDKNVKPDDEDYHRNDIH